MERTWTDKELDLVFKTLPTEENAERLGKVIDRTPDSIILAWKLSIDTKKRREGLVKRGPFIERCRRARIRNGWFSDLFDEQGFRTEVY